MANDEYNNAFKKAILLLFSMDLTIYFDDNNENKMPRHITPVNSVKQKNSTTKILETINKHVIIFNHLFLVNCFKRLNNTTIPPNNDKNPINHEICLQRT